MNDAHFAPGAVERLIADLGAAHAAATAVAGTEPLGIRAVEYAPGVRAYLCAFEGPRFVCLDAALRPEATARRVREIAGASLLWEHLEALVDPDALGDLVAAIGRILALGAEPRDVMEALETTASRALDLARWRLREERALASLVDMDAASAMHDRVHAAWSLFVRASEPLVERQDSLDRELVSALRAVEQAAGVARVAERLSEMLARAMPDCAEGADQVAAGHLTPLDRP